MPPDPATITADLTALEADARAQLRDASAPDDLERFRVEFLGRKGRLQAVFDAIPALPNEARAAIGRQANTVKRELEEQLLMRRGEVEAGAAIGRAERERIDVTLPGRWHRIGGRHPLRMMDLEVRRIFVGMGFDVVEGPEVEKYYYNFEALNYPPDHPAMDEQDSFYISKDLLLRTQTSGMQVRVMEERAPEPLRVVVPGRVYRREAVTATKSHTFHQCEGLHVDRGISMAHLRGCLEVFASELFGEQVEVRMRPDYFPFTEPSVDVSVTCLFCRAQGCRLCKHSGWLEIAGAGMVHPNVLRAGGYDPEQVSGYAFGMGIDRLAQLRYGIDNIRTFADNDMRYLAQFR